MSAVKFAYFLIILSIVVELLIADTENAVVITTTTGKLIGKTSTDRKGNEFYSFQSIPYAEPPIGNLRFRAPEPKTPWEGILNATKLPPKCWQKDTQTAKIVGDENCLYLNIYTPELPIEENDTLKSVMVFIHGGGFIQGSSDFYGPEFLLPGDVVLVTIQYRLGLFGFLSTNDQTLGVPGNAGLKDQVMALKWIKDNINQFGGDPDNITIFGESAGGSSVHFHMLSPMSRGLFHRAIAQSGCALNLWAVGLRGTSGLLAETLRITTNNETEQLDTLRNVAPEEIIAAQNKISVVLGIKKKWESGIVVETQTNEPSFLADNPLTIIRSGKFNQVPLMIGYNSNEGLLLEVLAKRATGNYLIINNNLFSYIPHDIDSNSTEIVNKEIEIFYFNGDLRSNKHNIQSTIDLITDTWFFYHIYLTVVEHAKVSKEPIYFYRFSADTKLNIFKNTVQDLASYPGASHVDDIGYLFKTSRVCEIKPESLEDISIDRIVTIWTNFAKYGNPTVEKNKLIKEIWKSVESNKVNFMDIGNELHSGVDPDGNRFQFWQKIYQKYSHNFN